MTDTENYAHITHRQDEFSGAYIRAICAVTGCGIEKCGLDHDKVDYTVSSRVRGKIKSKPKIDIQAKCQMRGDLSEEEALPFALDMATYDNLRDPLLTNPRILIVVYVPPDVGNWASQSDSELVLRFCAYWLSLKGLPEVANQSTKTVYLPRGNMFTPAALMTMMRNTSEGRDLS